MIKSILLIIAVVMAGSAALVAMLYSRQRSMLYYPTPEVRSTEAEAIRLSNDGQSLKVWQVERDTDEALLYFGGNAEDVSLNLVQFKQLFPRHSLFLLNYRGYGGSSGQPTEEGLFSDAAALYEYVRKRYRYIDVMGRSLGTGVAVYLGSEKELRRLVLVTPFDSMVDVASVYYPFLPVSLLLKDRFDSAARAEQLDMQILALIAEKDEVIPRRLSDGLVSALAPDRTSVAVIAGATHNSIGSFPAYSQALQLFLNRPVTP